MTDAATLAAALRACGITSPDLFTERFGVALATLAPAQAVALIRQHETAHHAPDYARALDHLRRRLTAGIAVRTTHPGEANTRRWLTLACRAVLLIARYARNDPAGEAAWCDTETGRWYAALDWPDAAPVLLDLVAARKPTPAMKGD